MANEKASTASIVEDDAKQRVQTPFKPGGVAATDDGLVASWACVA